MSRDPSQCSDGAATTPAREARVVALVRELATEMQPRRRDLVELGPDASLDQDFGIDSLGRAELLARIEHAFDTRLSEEIVMAAATPADLAEALTWAGQALAPADWAAAPLRSGGTGTVSVPRQATTLLQVLEAHCTAHPDRAHVQLSGTDDDTPPLTYDDLWHGAQAIAAGLGELGIGSGQAVATMLPTCADFFYCFFGALIAGAVPVPLYPPAPSGHLVDHVMRQAAILRNARAPILVAPTEIGRFCQLVQAQVESLTHIVAPDDLRRSGARPMWPDLAPEAPALVQYTSGSTGDPKGVVLSHANLVANIHGLAHAIRATPDDVVVNWLPLYHDMGLIGHWLGSLTYGCPMICIPPLRFMARPSRWLRAITQHGGTLSAAPNFAFEMCATRLRDADLADIDLSSWRMAGTGAEAVSGVTIDKFNRRFADHGFDPRAMTPMYGLAENAVAVTITPLQRGPRIDRIDRAALARKGRAQPSSARDASALDIVSCGVPIAGHQVRVVGSGGSEAGDREVGRIQFCGPSATAGYYRAPDKTAALFDDGWVNTGDLGYIADGELFITGREKDIIVRAGRNLYPDEIETAIGNIDGVRKGRVAVFAVSSVASGTEKLVVLAETRKRDRAAREILAGEVRRVVTSHAELPPDDIVLAQPGTVLKTNNGKIRRAACRQLYESGRLDKPPAAPWHRFLLLFGASVRPAWQRVVRAIGAFAFAAWFRIVYLGLAPSVWGAVVAAPGLRRRRCILRGAARLMLRWTGLAPEVMSAEHVTDGPVVFVANHASYLDSLVLSAVLPPRCAFVAKRELATPLIAGSFLRRLGTVFVERIDPRASLNDVDQLGATLAKGDALVVFPEGTFDRRPGLRPFHMGAFVTAARARAPVIPVAIRGTRAVLRGTGGFARSGRVIVTILPAIVAKSDDWSDVLSLRDQVRAAVLSQCGEPDLAHEPARPPTT